MDRVNEVVAQVVADRLERLSDPRLEMVTVTGAEVTGDLSRATIYWAVAGDDDRVAAAASGLASATTALRRAVGAEVRLRQTPELRFVRDPAIVEGARIEQILRDIHAAEERET
jgi:ribosome-binding factor A